MVSVKSVQLQKYSTSGSFHTGDRLTLGPGDLLLIDLMPFAILKFWVCSTFSVLVVFRVMAVILYYNINIYNFIYIIKIKYVLLHVYNL